MATWRRLEDTRHLCTLALISRAGEHAEAPSPAWRTAHVTIPRLDVSSSDLRERLAQGRPIDGLCPSRVVREIRERHLYTRPDGDGAR